MVATEGTTRAGSWASSAASASRRHRFGHSSTHTLLQEYVSTQAIRSVRISDNAPPAGRDGWAQVSQQLDSAFGSLAEELTAAQLLAKGTQLFAEKKRPGALQCFEEDEIRRFRLGAAVLQDPTEEERRQLLWNAMVVHSCFGDVELAQIPLKGLFNDRRCHHEYVEAWAGAPVPEYLFLGYSYEQGLNDPVLLKLQQNSSKQVTSAMVTLPAKQAPRNAFYAACRAGPTALSEVCRRQVGELRCAATQGLL
eukprot:scaffold547_cov384-Prasinococcus_capsulatus_cf.AAC.22